MKLTRRLLLKMASAFCWGIQFPLKACDALGGLSFLMIKGELDRQLARKTKASLAVWSLLF